MLGNVSSIFCYISFFLCLSVPYSLSTIFSSYPISEADWYFSRLFFLCLSICFWSLTPLTFIAVFFLISFHWHYPLVLSLHPCILLSTYPILIYDDKSVRFTKSSALDSHIQQKHNIIFSMENFTLDVQSILLKDIFKVLLNWKISKFKLRGKHWSEHRKDNRSKIIGQRANVVLIPEPDSEHWK